MPSLTLLMADSIKSFVSWSPENKCEDVSSLILLTTTPTQLRFLESRNKLRRRVVLDTADDRPPSKLRFLESRNKLRRRVALDTADDRHHQSFVSWSSERNCEDVSSLILRFVSWSPEINCDDVSSLTLVMTDSIKASFLGVQK